MSEKATLNKAASFRLKDKTHKQLEYLREAKDDSYRKCVEVAVENYYKLVKKEEARRAERAARNLRDGYL